MRCCGKVDAWCAPTHCWVWGRTWSRRSTRNTRGPDAVEQINQHLHNVPAQIAAERGLPALGIWLWFVSLVVIDLVRDFRKGGQQVLAAAGLAAMVSMLAAGLFEYNFGDSEFLMTLLLLITLPFAAARPPVVDLHA